MQAARGEALQRLPDRAGTRRRTLFGLAAAAFLGLDAGAAAGKRKRNRKRCKGRETRCGRRCCPAGRRCLNVGSGRACVAVPIAVGAQCDPGKPGACASGVCGCNTAGCSCRDEQCLPPGGDCTIGGNVRCCDGQCSIALPRVCEDV